MATSLDTTSNTTLSTTLSTYSKVDDLPLGFKYSVEFNIIICSSCKFAIKSKDFLDNHLKKYHSTLENKDIAFLKDSIKDLKVIEDKNIALPTFYNYNFKDLNREEVGYICLKCNSFATTSLKYIRNHLNIIEGIKSSKSNKGLDLKAYYKGNYPIQSFFIDNYKRYFAIKVLSSSTTISTTTNSSNSSNRDIEISILNSYKAKEKSLDSKAKIFTTSSNKDPKELSSFIKSLHFNEYLANKDISKYLTYIAKPNKDLEPLLDILYSRVLDLLYTTENIIPKFDKRLLQQLNTENINEGYKEMREFKALDSKSSKSKYYSTLANLIIYIFRLYLLYKEGKLDLENLDKQPILPDVLLERLNTILENLEAYSSIKDLIELESIASKLKFSLIEVIAILLAQETSQKTLDSKGIFNSPTITFLILKSIDPNTLYFKKVVEVEKLCSFLIYSFRLWFLAFLEAIEDIPTTLEDIFYNNYKLLLNNRSNNCFEALTQIRAYTRRIDSNLTKESRVIELDLDNLVIDNKKFSITKLTKFFSYIIDSLETILYRDLIEIDPSLLSIDLNSIEDDIRNSIPGFYFIDFITKTQDFSIYKDFLIKRLLDRNSSISIKYLKSINIITTRSNNSSGLKFNSKSIKSFLDNKTKFLELLAIAIYLTSGSPLRGEEVVVIKYLNTLESGLRNIVIEPKNGWIRINTTYHKSYNITRLDSNNIRFLSPRLSNILKLYLLIVIPFYKFIAIEYLNLEEISGFLLEENNTRFTSSRLSNILSKESNSFLLNSLTLNPYRHLITYIIKNRLDLDYNSSSNSEDENLIEDI